MTRDPGPPRSHLAVLFTVSASMLAFEVLLVRLFELSHWHHFAGLAISLALLGLGAAGSCLALAGHRPALRGGVLVAAGVAIQAVGTLVVIGLHARIALRPAFAAWDLHELGKLLLVDFAAFVPFFGAGLVVGQAFMRWPGHARSIYAANLLGSGAGSIAASGLLALAAVETVLALTALLPALALAGLAVAGRRRGMLALGAAVCVAAGAAVLDPPAPRVSDFKALSRVLDPPDARVLATRAGLPGTLTLVRSDSLRVAPGLSLEWREPVPAVDAAVVGGDRLVPLPRRFPAPAAHGRASLAGLPFALRPSGRALVLGASAWQSPAAAGRRALTWIEPDGRLLALAGERGLAWPDSERVADGLYRYLAGAGPAFELIALDAAFAGGDAATEDYLMTVDGLARALSRLSADGLLALPLRLSVPPRHTPRVLRTLRDALLQQGAARPGRHVAALRGLQEILLLASPRPLVSPDAHAIERFAERWRFDLVWLPGLSESRANRYHRLEEPVFHRTARAVFGNGALPPSVRWYETGPATLTRPYLWRSLAWERIPDFIRTMGRQRALSYLDWTLVLTAVSAALTALLAFGLILAPVRRLAPARGGGGRAAAAGLFGALGLGYMLLELLCFQRAILLAGEPVLAAAIVFAVFLVGSGLGSLYAPPPDGARPVRRLFAPIGAGAVLAAAACWPLAEPLLALPTGPRLALLALALTPLAVALGRPFPWALSRLARDAGTVPWAWSINGFASVLAASLATLVSVQWGHGATLAAALACYAAAALIAGWRPPGATAFTRPGPPRYTAAAGG